MHHYKAPDNSLHFIDSDEFAYLLPPGSVEITDEEADSLRQPPLPSHAALVTQTLIAARAKRQPIIGVLDGLQASALAKGDSATALMIETVKQGLRDITKVDLSACATEAEMRAAVMTAYAALVTANPAVATALKGVLA